MPRRSGKQNHKYKHGMSGSRTYQCWRNMLTRCYNPLSKDFPAYGKRGIKVCVRWKNNFKHFVKDLGLRPQHRTLDRINTNGNYTLKNCRWATKEQQYSNRRAPPKRGKLGHGKPHTEATKRKLSKLKRGQLPWQKQRQQASLREHLLYGMNV